MCDCVCNDSVVGIVIVIVVAATCCMRFKIGPEIVRGMSCFNASVAVSLCRCMYYVVVTVLCCETCVECCAWVPSSFHAMPDWIELDWSRIGLGVGLSWTGLSWIGLSWIGLSWIE